MKLKSSWRRHAGILSIWDDEGDWALHIGVSRIDWAWVRLSYDDYLERVGLGPIFLWVRG